MTTHFIVSVDVEEDNQWKRAKNYTLNNIKKLPKFHELCEKYSIKPTYLITYSIAKDTYSAKVIEKLSRTGNCEVGAHLHPWFTPPYLPPFVRAAYPHTYPHECPDNLLHRKIHNLSSIIKNQIGIDPKSFRAGRYGMDGRIVDYIREMGYLIDSSVTPYWTWTDTKGTTCGGPDYSNIFDHPFFVSSSSFPNPIALPSETKSILEIPITIKKTDDNEITWFRPFPWVDQKSLLNLIQSVIEKQDLVLNLMFHSSELLVGGSPYSETKNALVEIERKIEAIFRFVSEQGIKSSTLQEIHKIEGENIKRHMLNI
jgi:hypothetical protein